MKIRKGSFGTVKRIILPILLVILIISTSTVQGVDPAPDFKIKTTSDDDFRLSDHTGTPVVLDFMTPLCIECRKVEDDLKEIYPDYKDEFIFLTIDIENNSIERLQEHKSDRNIPWEIGQGDAQLFNEKYKGTAVPLLVIIDDEGFITYKKEGLISQDKVADEMDQVLTGDAERIGLRDYGIFGIAVIGGIASFFSPCSFPLLPSYIAYYIRPNNRNKEHKGKIHGISVGVKAAMGIISVFGIIGIIAVLGGRWISEYLPYLQPIVGTVIIILGIMMLSNVEFGAIFSILKIKIKRKLGMEITSNEPASPFIYGLGYGSSSASCTAPVFIAVVLSSWLSRGLGTAVIVLVLYLATMSLLMILFSYATIHFRKKIMNKLDKTFDLQNSREKNKKISNWINKLSAVVLLVVGTYLIYNFISTV